MESIKLNHEGLFNLEQPMIKVSRLDISQYNLQIRQTSIYLSVGNILTFPSLASFCSFQVPFEQMKRHFKSSQKLIEKGLFGPFLASPSTCPPLTCPCWRVVEMTLLQQKISQSPSSLSQDDVVEFLRKLPVLKSRLQEGRVQDLLLLQKTQARLDYLDAISPIQTVDEEAFDRWSKTRLNNLLVDYLSRCGFTNTASKLASDAGIEVGIFYLALFIFGWFGLVPAFLSISNLASSAHGKCSNWLTWNSLPRPKGSKSR